MQTLYTVEECRQHLEAWKAADLALATGQSYSIAGRTLTRANLDVVKDRIAYWWKELQKAQGSASGLPPRRRVYRGVPFD